MKLPKCCRSDTEEYDEVGDKSSQASCKSRSSPDGKYCEVDAGGKKVCRNLSAYECQLEDQVETLQNALFSLSSHYAKIQFRLRQITNANSCERQRLLRELEYIVSKGIDGQGEGEELPCLISDARLMGDARSKQRKIIKDLRSQLVDLSQSASLCFDTDEGGCYNFDKRRSYRIRYEYSGNAECEGDDDEEYYEPKHGVGCMCCNCNSRYAPNYPTCSCRQAAADKFREELEFDFSRGPKVNPAKDALERGYLAETWIPNDCNCRCDDQDDEESSKSNGKNRKKGKKRRGKSKEGKRVKVDKDDDKRSNGAMSDRSNNICTCTCADDNKQEKRRKKGKRKRGKSTTRNRKSSKASRTPIESPYERAAAYLNYYSDDQNTRHSKRDRNGGMKNRDIDNDIIIKCKCHGDYPNELREYEKDKLETSPDQTDPNYRPQRICREDCEGIPVPEGPHHPLHDARCQCCICKNRVAQDLAKEDSDSDQRTSILFEQVRKYDKVSNPLGIEDSDVYSDEQIEEMDKLKNAHITNPLGIEDSYAYSDEQEEKAERKQHKREIEKEKSSDSDQGKDKKVKQQKSVHKSENKFKTDIERSATSDRSKRSHKSRRDSDLDEQKIRNPLGITHDSNHSHQSEEKKNGPRCMRSRRSENSMTNNLIVKKASGHRFSIKSEKRSKEKGREQHPLEARSSESYLEHHPSQHRLERHSSERPSVPRLQRHSTDHPLEHRLHNKTASDRSLKSKLKEKCCVSKSPRERHKTDSSDEGSKKSHPSCLSKLNKKKESKPPRERQESDSSDEGPKKSHPSCLSNLYKKKKCEKTTCKKRKRLPTSQQEQQQNS